MERTSRWRRAIPFVASCLGGLMAISAVVWALFVDHQVYDLRWKLHTGEVLRYRTVMLMGTPDSQKYQVMTTRYEVGAVALDDTMEVTSVEEGLTIRNGGPNGPVVWDSASGASPPKDYSVLMTAVMVGVPIQLKIDARGNILSAQGMEVVQNRVKEGLGGDMFGLFTELPFSGNAGTLLGAVLPKARVRKAALWTFEGNYGNQAWGKTRYTNEYSLSAVKNGIATITLTGTKHSEDMPGEIAKALKTQSPPDPSKQHGQEDVTDFSIDDGVVMSQINRVWTQGTITNGKIFRFDSSSETKLIERRMKDR